MSLLVATTLLVSWRWLPTFELDQIERELVSPPHREHAPERTTLAPPPAPRTQTITLADEVIVRALDRGRAAFLGCYKRAAAADPLLDAVKVRLRLEIDPQGLVVAVTHDAPSDKLGNCLVAVSRGLRFAAPETPAIAEFPLLFRPE